MKKGKRGFASILEKPGCSREPRVFQENIGFPIEPYEFFGFGFPRYINVNDVVLMSVPCACMYAAVYILHGRAPLRSLVVRCLRSSILQHVCSS